MLGMLGNLITSFVGLHMVRLYCQPAASYGIVPIPSCKCCVLDECKCMQAEGHTSLRAIAAPTRPIGAPGTPRGSPRTLWGCAIGPNIPLWKTVAIGAAIAILQGLHRLLVLVEAVGVLLLLLRLLLHGGCLQQWQSGVF